VLKFFPAPVGSTFAVKDRDPSVPALKSVALVMKVPLASATTAVLASMVEATSMLPQGCEEEGRCTSFRTAVPLTPRAGVMIACALICAETAKRRETVAKTLENMTGSSEQLIQRERKWY